MKTSKSEKLSDYAGIVSSSQVFTSACLAIFGFISTKVCFSGEIVSGLDVNYINSISIPFDIIVFILFFVVILGFIVIVNCHRETIAAWVVDKGATRSNSLLVFIIACALMLVFWVPYIVAYAPGSVLGDSLSSIGQALSGSYNNHHPLLYTLLVGVFVHIGNLLGDMNLGILLYAIFQSAVLASTLSYTVSFCYKLKARRWFLVCMISCYCIAPFFPTYGIILWKDILFSCTLVMLSFAMLTLCLDESKLASGRNAFKFFLLCLLASFLRNNGIAIVAAIIPCIAIAFRKKGLAVILAASLSLAVYVVVQGPIFRALDIDTPTEEAFGIPLQQIAFVISEHPEELSVEQREEAARFLPYEKWSQVYAPCLVDTIKWDTEFDRAYLESHKTEFVTLWGSLLLSRPLDCFKAYMLSTVGFWHPTLQNSYGYIDTYIHDNEYAIRYMNPLGDEWSGKLRNLLGAFRPQVSSGMMFWILAVCATLTWSNNRRRILFFLPGFFCWLTIMVATPVAFSLRYVYILAMLAPVYLFIPFLKNEASDKTAARSESSERILDSA